MIGLALLVSIEALTFRIGRECLLTPFFVMRRIEVEAQFRIHHRLSGRCIHHGIADTIAGMLFCHDIQVAHVIENPLCLDVLIVRRKLHEIDSNGQTFHRERVGIDFIVRLSDISPCLLDNAGSYGFPLDFVINLFIAHIVGCTSVHIYACHRHRQRTQVAHTCHFEHTLPVG